MSVSHAQVATAFACSLATMNFTPKATGTPGDPRFEPGISSYQGPQICGVKGPECRMDTEDLLPRNLLVGGPITREGEPWVC